MAAQLIEAARPAIKSRYQNPRLAKMFDVCLAVAADNFSEFYVVTARSGGHGPNPPRRGAAHRHAFWNGYNGTQHTTIADSLARAAFMAGRAFGGRKGKV